MSMQNKVKTREDQRGDKTRQKQDIRTTVANKCRKANTTVWTGDYTKSNEMS